MMYILVKQQPEENGFESIAIQGFEVRKKPQKNCKKVLTNDLKFDIITELPRESERRMNLENDTELTNARKKRQMIPNELVLQGRPAR